MSEVERPVYVRDQVREVERLHRDLLTDAMPRLPIRDQLDRQAHRIAEAHWVGDRALVTLITCRHPTLVCHSADEIMNGPFTLDDARKTVANLSDRAVVERRRAAKRYWCTRRRQARGGRTRANPNPLSGGPASPTGKPCTQNDTE